MDLINQNKLKNLLIIVLLVVNCATVSIIWIQTAKRDEPQPGVERRRQSESVNLMKKAIDLDEEQTKQLEKIRTDKLDQSKKFNDSLDLLKKQLAEELFSKDPDTNVAKIKSEEIGNLQTKVGLIRFNHFKELSAICTPAQKEKLKPILVELFGRKPSKDETIKKKIES